jgi:hypothetical protein
MQAPTFLEEQLRPNLEKLVIEFVSDGEEVMVTDSNLPLSLKLKIEYD